MKAQQGFLDGVFNEVQIAKFLQYYHSHKSKERFLKKIERVTGFFILMTMLSFKQNESKNGKKEPCERG